MGYIYCITNRINGKRYVGKTTSNPQVRFKEHCRDSKKERCNKRPLYDAMNKYGIENFIVEEIEHVVDDNLLSEREVFWIKELGTFGSKGYNASKGGDGKILYDYREIIELYNLGYSQTKIARTLNCDQGTVHKVLKANGIDTHKNERNDVAREIDQYDLAGNYIQTFKGSLKAAQWLVDMGIGKSVHSFSNHIIDTCLGKQRKCGGYLWKYKS